MDVDIAVKLNMNHENNYSYSTLDIYTQHLH